MNTFKKKTALIVLTILATLLLAACGSDSNNSSDDPEGVLSVYTEAQESTPGFSADAPAPSELAGLRELHVTFTYLKLRKTGGSTVTVIDDASGTGTIDLVAAWSNPALVGSLNIPQGDYDGIAEGTISLVEITDDEGETCTVMQDDEFDFGPVIMKGSITVDDTGSVGIDVGFPVVSGECDPESGVGTVSFSSVYMWPHSEE